MREPCTDRADAGRRLARDLGGPARWGDAVVLGLPRGGVPVAAEVAAALAAPLDVLVVRELGLPGFPELAVGAVAGVGGEVEAVRDDEALAHHRVEGEEFDGLTGATVRAAVAAVRRRAPARVVVAAPVGARRACEAAWEVADEVVCSFVAVEGDWPDCYRLNRSVPGVPAAPADPREVLDGFGRWRTWMWANSDVVDFTRWLRGFNTALPEADRVGLSGAGRAARRAPHG
ncbi:erythromycin esterase family protein [Kineococcus sp. G2]|uniref:erythromycin esterase family protein n=1 Tax=Kineococcus sp. G2 TaxID=3127484 RepID=UPI00301D9298